MSKKLTDRIMHTLEKEHISPRPRWEFMLKNSVLWIAGITSLLIGGIASAIIIFASVNSDVLLYSYLSDSMFNYIVRVLPFIWIVSFILFLTVAIYQMRHTKRGYRYSFSILILSNIFASILVGVFLYNFGMAHVIDAKMAQWMPIYRGIEEQRRENWTQPDRGMLAGYILETSSESFVLRDFKGDDWNILSKNLSEIDIMILNNFDEVGIFGELLATSTFRACGIRPWEVRGGDKNIQEQVRNRIIRMNNDMPERQEQFIHSLNKGEEHNRLNIKNQKGFPDSERKLSELRTIMCDDETTIQDTLEITEIQ